MFYFGWKGGELYIYTYIVKKSRTFSFTLLAELSWCRHQSSDIAKDKTITKECKSCSGFWTEMETCHCV